MSVDESKKLLGDSPELASAARPSAKLAAAKAAPLSYRSIISSISEPRAGDTDAQALSGWQAKLRPPTWFARGAPRLAKGVLRDWTALTSAGLSKPRLAEFSAFLEKCAAAEPDANAGDVLLVFDEAQLEQCRLARAVTIEEADGDGESSTALAEGTVLGLVCELGGWAYVVHASKRFIHGWVAASAVQHFP